MLLSASRSESVQTLLLYGLGGSQSCVCKAYFRMASYPVHVQDPSRMLPAYPSKT